MSRTGKEIEMVSFQSVKMSGAGKEIEMVGFQSLKLARKGVLEGGTST